MVGSSILRNFVSGKGWDTFAKMEEFTIGFKDKTVYEWGEMLDWP
jgi:hypothetical protein